MCERYFLLPVENQYVFVDQNLVSQGEELQQWSHAWCADSDHGIAYATDIVVYRDPSGTVWNYELPKDFKPKRMCFLKEMLLIGGQGGTQKIFAVSLKSKQILNVDQPKLLLKFRKSIDGFFVCNDVIHAIDNNIHPKYILRYVPTDGALRYVDKIRLHSQAPEEKVKQGVLWQDRVVLLSKSAHRAGSTTFLSFYTVNDMSLYATLSWHKLMGYGTGLNEIMAIKIVKGKLILLTNIGVHMLEQKNSPTESDLQLIHTIPRLIDAHLLADGSWMFIQKGFGNRKTARRL